RGTCRKYFRLIMDLKRRNKHFAAIDFWSWLIPVTYLIHIVEEYWGGEGYSAYILRVRGVHFSSARFLVVQCLGAMMMAGGVILARRFNFPHLMVIIMASIVLVNGLTHTLTSISNGGYGPGLFSSLLIWMPLGIFLLVHFKKKVSRKRYLLGIAIGVVVNVLVALVTMRGARLV
ncbi:MAG: HXXEE domain-containing protein, partial [bacterium]